MATPAQVGSTANFFGQPRDQSYTLGPANVGRATLGAPQGAPVLIPVLLHPLHNKSANARRYRRLASESESRERFLRLRFLASAALTRIFCPGFK
jgi:hypothetical protein